MSGMTKRTTIEAQIGDIDLGTIQIRDGSGGAFLVDVNDPGVGLDCMAVQTTPIPGAPASPTAERQIRGTGNAALAGAVPQSARVTLAMGAALGKALAIRLTRTALGPGYTSIDIAIYTADPGAGPFAALPDNEHQIYRQTAAVPPAAALGQVINLVPVGPIAWFNTDVAQTNNLYAVVIAQAGVGGGTDTYLVEVVAAEMTV